MRLVIFVVSLILIVPLVGCTESPEPLVQLGTQKEANEVLVALTRGNVQSATVTQETVSREVVWTVQVSPEDLAHSRELLLQYDLPRERHSGYEDMLAHQGIIPSPSDDRARLMHAMAGELERTFELYDQVVSARVHVVLPQSDPLRRRGQPAETPTALVVIKYLLTDEEFSAGGSAAESLPASASEGPVSQDAAFVEQRIFGSTGRVESMVRSAVGSAIDQPSSPDASTSNDDADIHGSSGIAINVQFTPSFRARPFSPSEDRSEAASDAGLVGQAFPVNNVVIGVMGTLAALVLLFMVLYLRERKRAVVESNPQSALSSMESEFTP